MANIFESLQTYGGNWNVTAERDFDANEINMVSKAEVVPSQYGMSVCFFMKAGGQTYIPLSRDSDLCVGDAVDLTKAKVLTLSRDGEEDITRIQA